MEFHELACKPQPFIRRAGDADLPRTSLDAEWISSQGLHYLALHEVARRRWLAARRDAPQPCAQDVNLGVGHHPLGAVHRNRRHVKPNRPVFALSQIVIELRVELVLSDSREGGLPRLAWLLRAPQRDLKRGELARVLVE